MAIRYQLRTLLLLAAAVGSYITLFRLAWHWVLLGTVTAIALMLSLLVTREWMQLPAAKRPCFEEWHT